MICSQTCVTGEVAKTSRVTSFVSGHETSVKTLRSEALYQGTTLVAHGSVGHGFSHSGAKKCRNWLQNNASLLPQACA
jgi:hypothetical protein